MRYDFTHEIPGPDGQWWHGEKVEKGRRISIIIRVSLVFYDFLLDSKNTSKV